MAFFNQDTANTVQVISFFLELVGLPLVIIEIYFKGLRNKLEDLIDYFAELDVFDSIMELLYNKVYVVVMTVLLLLTPYFAFKLAQHSSQGSIIILLLLFVYFTISFGAASFFLTGSIFVGFTALISIPARVVKMIVSVLNKLTNGDGIGGFGLILAALGFLGEVYQMIVLYQ